MLPLISLNSLFAAHLTGILNTRSPHIFAPALGIILVLVGVAVVCVVYLLGSAYRSETK